MTKWRYELDIKPYITNKEDETSIVYAARGIARELYKLPPSLFDMIAEDVDYLENMSVCDLDFMTREEMLEELNSILSSIYDFADSNRVWLG